MKCLTLWDFNDIDISLSRFESALADPEYAHEIDGVQTQIARCYGLKKEFEKADDMMTPVGENLDSKSDLIQAYYYIETGRILNLDRKPAEAKPYFLKAIDIAEHGGLQTKSVLVDALHMMAIIEPRNARKWNDEAFQIVEKSRDPAVTKWKASLCNNLGWSFFDERDFEQALDYFTLALSERVTIQQKKDITIARWCVARVHRQLGNWDQALHMQEHNLKETPDDHFVHEELALIYAAFDNKDAAKLHAVKALAVLEKDDWITKEDPERLIVLQKML